MTALVYLVSIAGAALCIFTDSPLLHLAGAIGWLCIVPVWATALDKRRGRARLERIYRAAWNFAWEGECCNDLGPGDCLHRSKEECGACWVCCMGQDPEAFREWYRNREART